MPALLPQAVNAKLQRPCNQAPQMSQYLGLVNHDQPLLAPQPSCPGWQPDTGFGDSYRLPTTVAPTNMPPMCVPIINYHSQPTADDGNGKHHADYQATYW